MTLRFSLILLISICARLLYAQQSTWVSKHPLLYATNEDRPSILEKTKNEEWAKQNWQTILDEIDPYVNKHIQDPEWIVSRLAMYWKKGERYTQCYIKKQDWDYGEGDAPVPTVRLPGMRRWNDFVNVPLEDRTPYNETGDLWGVSRSNGDTTPVLIPYKKTGHMIRQNNMEILRLAEKSAFVYYMTQDEKYAKFSSDILWTWLLGTYYMEPPLDPEKSSKGPGGYESGGILGFYDYEVIHDDRQIPAATIYDFMHSFLENNPHPHLQKIGLSSTELAGVVFKRFIEVDLGRGGRRGNWNVNRYKNLINSILVLENNDFYEDGKGKEHYIPYYTEVATDHLAPLPEIMSFYNDTTGLWPESPGYASAMIPTVLSMGVRLYRSDMNTIGTNPIIQKAAKANLSWLDARGNLVLFGDMRGGSFPFEVFENLLTYYTWEGDVANAKSMSSIIRNGIASGKYDRAKSNWYGLCMFQELVGEGADLPFNQAVYSRFHRHIIMKNGNDVEDGLMFTLYGGKGKSHLTKNGLAVQYYGKGWALAPDASAYESYWTADSKYHRGILGSNTIVPGYTEGDIVVNAMDPYVNKTALANASKTSDYCSFVDVSADEKRRLVAMIRTSASTGYYVDVFRSDQQDNDYIYHNLGNFMTLKDGTGKVLKMEQSDNLGTEYHEAYSYFENARKMQYSDDFISTWTVRDVSPNLNIDLWMMGQNNRDVYSVDAPPTTLRSDVTPGQVNKSPQTTPTLIVRQTNNNAKKSPFVSVFESYYEGEKNIKDIKKVESSDSFICLEVNSHTLSSQQIIYNALDDELHKLSSKVAFRGTFGISSFKGEDLHYLYLGKGKLIQQGSYKIEAVEEAATAELKIEDGKVYYTSDQPINITLNKGKEKTYQAGSDVLIK